MACRAAIEPSLSSVPLLSSIWLNQPCLGTKIGERGRWLAVKLRLARSALTEVILHGYDDMLGSFVSYGFKIVYYNYHVRGAQREIAGLSRQ